MLDELEPEYFFFFFFLIIGLGGSRTVIKYH